MQNDDRADEIDYNPMYKALQNEFKGAFELAQSQCCVVCIPQETSLPTTRPLKRTFIESHFLVPSRTVKDVYECNFFGKRVEWSIKERHVKSKSLPVMEAAILAEVTGFNASNERYTVVLISQPLDRPYSEQMVVPPKRSLVDYCLLRRDTTEEYKKFLYSFEELAKELLLLENSLNQFNNNYLIVDSLLQHTSHKLSSLVSTSGDKLVSASKRLTDCPDSRVQDSVKCSVESYIMGRCHTKVFAAVQRWCGAEDKLLSKCCETFNVESALKELHEDFRCSFSKSIAELSNLDSKGSPTEKLGCFGKVLDCIPIDVKDSHSSNLRYGDPNVLTSDDIIAILVIVIVQAKCRSLASNLYYMENFCWSALLDSQTSYYLSTFQAAMHSLKQKPPPKSDQPLPSSSRSQAKRRSNSKPRRSSDIIDHASSDLYRGQSSFDHQRGYHDRLGSYHGHQRNYGSQTNQDQTHYHDHPGGYSSHQRSYDSQDQISYHNQRGHINNQRSLDQRIDSEQSLNSKLTGHSDQQDYNDIKINSSTADSSQRKDYGPFISKLMEQSGPVSSNDN
ncbi:ankyrin repeat domain-containing protein 27-like [Dysidea avara]|uniref:ankyrin repeat domain-containing protein 27-like n=1 Tax=Dysidea avara TaxID=196820 RepID=UPI003318F9B6